VDNNRRVTLIFKKTNDTDTWLNPLCVGEIEVALTKKRRGVSAFFLRFFFLNENKKLSNIRSKNAHIHVINQ